MSQESMESRFTAFATQSLQNHAQILGVLNTHSEQLKDVRKKLDEHLYDHLKGLQKTLEEERTSKAKNTELWIGTVIGVVGVAIAAVAIIKG